MKKKTIIKYCLAPIVWKSKEELKVIYQQESRVKWSQINNPTTWEVK